MSTSSISALGLLTNTEPLRLVPDLKPTPDKEKKDDIKLIFFGTFFHDSNVSKHQIKDGSFSV